MSSIIYLDFKTANTILKDKCLFKIVPEQNFIEDSGYFNVASWYQKPMKKTGKYFFYIDTWLSETKIGIQGNDLNEYYLNLELEENVEYKECSYYLFKCTDLNENSNFKDSIFRDKKIAFPILYINQTIWLLKKNYPNIYTENSCANIIGL